MGIAVASSLVARQAKHVVLLLASGVGDVGVLVVRSCSAVSVVGRGGRLLAALGVDCEHGSPVGAILYLDRWLDINLYLGAGRLVLIVVDRSVADGARNVRLIVVPAVSAGSAE